MEENNWFKYLHSYNALVRVGIAKPLRCPDDDSRYYITVKWEDGEINDIPRLSCAYCYSTITPGLELLEQVRAVVKEHTYD